ncbi:MAG TPA: hypothetical protein VN823_10710 [Stellaceae bacterium]|nr:hypothetical protein [Stellaceae bacterium]
MHADEPRYQAVGKGERHLLAGSFRTSLMSAWLAVIIINNPFFSALLVVKGDLTAGVSPLTKPANLSLIMQAGRRMPRIKEYLPR